MATPSEELQIAVYQALINDAGVGALAGDHIYDGRRPEDFSACITFGPSDYTPEDAECLVGRIESLQIDCWVRDQRLRPARALADAVKAALHDADMTLATHRLASIQVTAVRAFMDPDGITGHGIVTIEAEIEEA